MWFQPQQTAGERADPAQATGKRDGSMQWATGSSISGQGIFQFRLAAPGGKDRMHEDKHVGCKMARALMAGREFFHVDEPHVRTIPAQIAHGGSSVAEALRMQGSQGTPGGAESCAAGI